MFNYLTSHKGAHWFIPIDQLPGGCDSLVTEINTPSQLRQSGCTETCAHKLSAWLHGLKWKLCTIYHASLESSSTRGNVLQWDGRTGGRTETHEYCRRRWYECSILNCGELWKKKTTSAVNWHPSLLSVYVTSQLTSARQWPSTCLCMVPQRCHKTCARSFAWDDRAPGALPPGPNFPLWKWIARP